MSTGTEQKIISNKVKYNACGQIIHSIYTEDTVVCSCGATRISGGALKLMREGNNYTEMSEYFLTEN